MLGKYILLLGLLLSLILPGITANAQATASTPNFIIYNEVNASSKFIGELSYFIQYVYNDYVINNKLSMMQPCNGSKYIVYVTNNVSNLGGYVSYGPLCINYIEFSSSANIPYSVYYVLLHMTSYFAEAPNYDSTWYGVASSIGLTEYFSKICNYVNLFFINQYWLRNPYDYFNQYPYYGAFPYGALFYWLMNQYTPQFILTMTLNSTQLVSAWVDVEYVIFLTSIVHGVYLCGTLYKPSFSVISPNSTLYLVMPGLTARYFVINGLINGALTINAYGNVTSDVVINETIFVTNGSVYVALVNPTLSQELVKVVVTYHGSTISGFTNQYLILILAVMMLFFIIILTIELRRR
ncbi:hypothetical protein [Caldivirga maquilingensis]|uniref:Uncharacterized protein n=1 Tax=Caldivirga maquilingensis (strain ATCC 700844 / DSM 13496 / JCM 10307 / IC-167) TaxID=397948 RepID=A8M9V9_CALMQ|nr:hypothetical protein [Caldivirga maquilingensis]ABW02430.1 conserved hypothetical protein [Caldivirga maquilingensis IC-167]